MVLVTPRPTLVEAEAATAASQKSTTTTVPLHTNQRKGTQIDEKDEEELSESDLDELGW